MPKAYTKTQIDIVIRYTQIQNTTKKNHLGRIVVLDLSNDPYKPR